MFQPIPFLMNVRQFKHIIFDMLKYNYDEDREDGIVFSPEDSDEFYPANRIYEEMDGNVIIDYDESIRSKLDIKQIDRELSKFDKDAEIHFQISEYGDFRVFEIMDSWDAEDEYLVLTVTGEEEFIDEVDFTDAGDRDTATVGQLADEILDYGKMSNPLYASDNFQFDCASVDSIYPRDGKVMLESKETANGNSNSLTLDHIVHCLKLFDRSTDVLFVRCDEDNDIEVFNVTGCYVEKGKMILDVDDR